MGLVAGKQGSVYCAITRRTRVNFIYHYRDENTIKIIADRAENESVGRFTYYAPYNAMRAMLLIIKKAVEIKADRGFGDDNQPVVATDALENATDALENAMGALIVSS
jgi:hypothetical protein